MTQKPASINFSVIIPTYNRSDYVILSVISALRQKNVSLEVLVVDDGSDDTEYVLKKIKDKRLYYIKNKKRLGYALNVKKCFQLAKGDYIFTLGDDDIILDENTLANVLKVMEKYDVGLGKIGGFSYDQSLEEPVQSYVLSNKEIILKPKENEEIILKLFDFAIGFYSGLVFKKSYINMNKFIDHMGYAYFQVVWDLVRKYGCAYIPDYFIIAHISLYMMPTYFDIKKHGSFFMEDLFKLVDSELSKKDALLYKQEFLKREIFLLPHIHYFSSYSNLLRVLVKLTKLDNRQLRSPKFYMNATAAFLPKWVMLIIRNQLHKRSVVQTKKLAKLYHYQKKLEMFLQDVASYEK